jgi:hypothetical protein
MCPQVGTAGEQVNLQNTFGNKMYQTPAISLSFVVHVAPEERSYQEGRAAACMQYQSAATVIQ